MSDAFGGYGGIAQYNRDALTAMASLSWIERVDVLPRLSPERLTKLPDRINQHSAVHRRTLYSLAALRCGIYRPDIVFSGHMYHGPLAWLVAKACGARLVSQLHGDEVWTKLPLHHLMPLRASGLVLCVSRDTRQRYLDQGVSQNNSAVVPNTVGADFVPGDRAAAREQFSIGEETAILTVARLDTRGGYKGQDRIISLLRSLRADGSKVIYLVAGEGADRARLEALARDHGVTEWVRFLGKVPRSELPALYRAADLFALPSTGEGFGIAFLEAMGCGTPAIGLAVGGAPDALEGLGLCVAEDAFPKSLADAIKQPKPDPERLSRAVHARFGFPSFRDRMGEVLDCLRSDPSLRGIS